MEAAAGMATTSSHAWRVQVSRQNVLSVQFKWQRVFHLPGRSHTHTAAGTKTEATSSHSVDMDVVSSRLEYEEKKNTHQSFQCWLKSIIGFKSSAVHFKCTVVVCLLRCCAAGCISVFLIGACATAADTVCQSADLNVNYQCILTEEMINLLYLASVW